jgi:hypothetical protein
VVTAGGSVGWMEGGMRVAWGGVGMLAGGQVNRDVGCSSYIHLAVLPWWLFLAGTTRGDAL